MKLKATFCAIALTAAAFGCDKSTPTSSTNTTSVNVDNTKMNTRDNGTGSPTPLDQGNSRGEIQTTQAIRKAIMADDTLSTDAKNVKVVTNDGVVTLRGPVKTAAEKASIEAKAVAAAGMNRVDDRIDVEAAK